MNLLETSSIIYNENS